MQITFWGAAQTVTGSQHLVDTGEQRILLDCGLFQGRRADAYAINQHLPFDARDVDSMVLSHAHIDHSGNIPNLSKSGYDGRVICTHATRDLCAVMLRDSAHIQEDDMRFLSRHGKKGVTNEPIYTMEDAEQALHKFVSYDYGRSIPIERKGKGANTTVTFGDAGHMLGSAWVLLETAGANTSQRLCFSGDLGRVGLPILRDPLPMPDADYLILESTYGDRLHDPIETALPELQKAIQDVARRGGKLLIPAFAVGRTQELIYHLNQLMIAGTLPSLPVFVDSPLAINVTEAFRMHPECYDAETRDLLNDDPDGDVFGFPRVSYTRMVSQSKAINDVKGPAIIISASGMCENGRILHHLRQHIEDPRSMILFVSFQAPNTLGRKILDQWDYVNILGDQFKIKAEVRRIEAFSGHADRNNLLDWVRPQVKNLRGIFLVHGEPEPMKALAGGLRDIGVRRVEMPARGETFDLPS